MVTDFYVLIHTLISPQKSSLQDKTAQYLRYHLNRKALLHFNN